MNEPRRLSKSGGVSQRLLDSASIDKPSQAARARANALAATASSFARTHSRSGEEGAQSGRKLHSAKTLATWVIVGAAASVALALISSRLLDSSSQRSTAAPGAPAMSVLAEPAPAPTVAPARSPEISPEPPAPASATPTLAPAPSYSIKPSGAATIEPWVPSPVAAASAAPPTGASKPSTAAFADEAREIEAARVAVSRGDDSGALAKLNDYDSSHPNGALKPESMALRIQVLSSSGKTSEARTLANEFQGKYPQHPLVQQLKQRLAL
jgi:hypothetical protein